MRVYTQFYDNRPAQCPFPGIKTWYVEQLGSDAILIIKGRKCLENMIEVSKMRADQLLNRPAAFRIFKGERIDSNNVPLTGIIEL